MLESLRGDMSKVLSLLETTARNHGAEEGRATSSEIAAGVTSGVYCGSCSAGCVRGERGAPTVLSGSTRERGVPPTREGPAQKAAAAAYVSAATSRALDVYHVIYII